MDTGASKKIEEFFAKYRLRYFDRGQILMRAGDEPPGIFYLIGGQVRQYDITEKGEEVVVDVLKPPAFFPMTWAINKTPNQYFFETFERTELRTAPVSDVIAFLKANQDVVYHLLSSLYSDMDGTQRRMAHMMGGSGHSRVLFELVLECKRFGKAQIDGSCVLSMHEDELARRAGLSRETISHELIKLENMKIIDVTHREIIIKNMKQLEETLGSQL